MSGFDTSAASHTPESEPKDDVELDSEPLTIKSLMTTVQLQLDKVNEVARLSNLSKGSGRIVDDMNAIDDVLKHARVLKDKVNLELQLWKERNNMAKGMFDAKATEDKLPTVQDNVQTVIGPLKDIAKNLRIEVDKLDVQITTIQDFLVDAYNGVPETMTGAGNTSVADGYA